MERGKRELSDHSTIVGQVTIKYCLFLEELIENCLNLEQEGSGYHVDKMKSDEKYKAQKDSLLITEDKT